MLKILNDLLKIWGNPLDPENPFFKWLMGLPWDSYGILTGVL